MRNPPFPPHLTHRQLDWSTKMILESPFHGYPTCLTFDHVVWWSAHYHPTQTQTQCDTKQYNTPLSSTTLTQTLPKLYSYVTAKSQGTVKRTQCTLPRLCAHKEFRMIPFLNLRCYTITRAPSPSAPVAMSCTL